MSIIQIQLRTYFATFLMLIAFAPTWCQPNSLPNRAAQKAYELARELIRNGKLTEAEQPLLKAIDQEPLWLEPRISLAAVYFEQQEWKKSRNYFQSVIAVDSSAEPMIYYKLGEIDWIRKDYTDLCKNMITFLKTDRIKPSIRTQAEKYLRDATFLLGDNVPAYQTEVKPLPNTINTIEALEYLPSFPAREDIMIFTRRLNGQEDFYLSNYKDHAWQISRPIIELNTPGNEGAHCLSADGKMLIFSAEDRKGGLGSLDLYYSLFDGLKWTPPANLGPQVNSRYWDGQPSLSSNGRTLYFSSERPGGKGGRDLWKVDRKGGGWAEPSNLSELNTAGNEEVPFVHAADETLYFMSDGWPGFGGTDLFLSHLENDNWQTPVNLGSPINTDQDEGALHVNLSGTQAFYALTTLDPDGRRQIDIYSFEMPEALRPQAATYANIRILDQQTQEPLQSIIEMINLRTTKIFTKALSDKNGELLVCIPTSEEFALNISRADYTFHSEHIEVKDQLSIIDPIEFTIYLARIVQNTEINKEPVVLNNIFFESGSAQLLNKSEYELNQLYRLLQSNEAVKMEIRGHTDNVGNDEDNQLLSEQRAKAIYDYLLAQGINEGRLTYRGFGETMPIADNDSEDGRQKNRRTEFLILEDGQK